METLTERGGMEEAQDLVAKIQEVYGDRITDEQQLRIMRVQAQIALHEDRSADAMEILSEIVERDPEDGRALLLLGNFLGRTDEADDLERAVGYFEQAIELDDYRVRALVALGRTYVFHQQYGKAVEYLEEAQELDYRDNIQEYLEAVQRLRRMQEL